MRTRLMVSILALVAGALILTSVGSIFLIRNASVTTAEQQLYTQAKAVAQLSPDVFLKRLPAVKLVGQYDALTVIGLNADGSFSSTVPSPINAVSLDTSHLLADKSEAGARGDLVYVLIPLEFTTAQKAALTPPIPYQATAVLVATRTTTSTVKGSTYFLLVALGSLAIAALVAFWLANRFSRPLLRARAATEAIASGSLDARIESSSHDLAEFGSLASAINTMAEELERARDQQRHFLLSVSHDLRTPLTSIRGYAEAIAEGATTDIAGAVSTIGAEAQRLERLVQDLLDLARLDAQRFSLRMESVEVAEAIAATAERFRPEAAAAGLELVTAELPLGLAVNADPDRVAQMLSNLVENAFRFAATEIAIGAAREPQGISLWVSDDGSGITPEDLGRVFEPHFTSDRSGPRRRGTGLGLAIVSELAQAMGGSARAESPIDATGGTRITVTLPPAPPPAGVNPATNGFAQRS